MEKISKELKEKIIYLANKYETKEFLKKDPSKFMHNYSLERDQEIIAFMSANLAFGRREQILLHIEKILQEMNGSPYDWICFEKYKDFFCAGNKSFYRMYSHNAMCSFFETVRKILLEKESLGEYYKRKWENSKEKLLCEIISDDFTKECNLISHGKNSASKKINMFLRWMVRDNSPVDLGLWSDWYSKKDLIIPLDTHVLQEATKLSLLELNKSGKIKSSDKKTALELTEKMKEIFPEDPVKSDFALFGLGVDIKPS
jgi:uncharacterized protein (TIGR02757 family)